MHPLIFLKEQLPAYVKIQNNWIFQFLTEQEKKDYIQQRRPIYMPPTVHGYHEYLDSIHEYTKNKPDHEVLSIQTFACHGIIEKGSQKVLINKKDEASDYYHVIDVEM